MTLNLNLNNIPFLIILTLHLVAVYLYLSNLNHDLLSQRKLKSIKELGRKLRPKVSYRKGFKNIKCQMLCSVWLGSLAICEEIFATVEDDKNLYEE